MPHLIRLGTAALELTLACPCRCLACGSNAGSPRTGELTFDEMIALVRDLAALGCRRLTFSGGEPLMRPDWPEIAAAANESGIAPDMITSGIGLDAACAAKIRHAGLISVTVSVDGTKEIHDRLRGVEGGYEQALDALRFLDEAGVRAGVTTQVNAWTLPVLDTLAAEIQQAGAIGWQLQLTMPSGRGAGATDLVLPPGKMSLVHETIRRLQKRRGLRPFITDNIGYLTSDDPVLRTPARTAERCWMGCFAGLRVLGITSSGDVKGCLSLPDSFIEGNVRDEPLEKIWSDPRRFAYNRLFSPESLGGACIGCAYAKICRGGCTAMAVAVHGRPGISTHCLRLAQLE
jgi:radical SAM protein with 4Fe4S-binding SPASM domain